MKQEVLDRWLERIAFQDDGCWFWTAGKTGDGYGAFYSDSGKQVLAHRFGYEQVEGAIPDGLVIDHLCRVPACVNPDHLEAVTNRENLRRGINGVLTTHCPRGHDYADNTWRDPKTGHRHCRACNRERQAERRRNIN